ncbi:MAG: hypothetical protein H0W23_10390 [Chloroflexia bacterium]|nr:hypothetical protein [Chloroflexia bacterium]
MSTGGKSREALRDELLKLSGSALERQFVHWLHDGGYRLPDLAQHLITDPYTRPDFYQHEGRTCIYVDGPHHEQPDRQMIDDFTRRLLERRGYQVVVVTYPDRWVDEIGAWTDVFGTGGTRR